MSANEAIVFRDQRIVEVINRPVPEPEADEVLIETDRSLISPGTERAMLAGTHQPDNLPTDGFPLDPGYSNVGHVIDVGDGVDDNLVGVRVGSATPHAQYVTANREAIVRVPDAVSTVAATFFRLAGVAMNAVRRGELRWGEPAAVRGLGLVGQLAVRTALVAGATPVYAIDLDAGRVAAAPDHDRVEPVRVTEDDEPGDGIAPVVIDATGNPEALGDGVSLIREDGRFVVVGCPRRTVEFDFYRSCIVPSAHIIGAYRIHGGGKGRWNPEAYGELFFNYVRSGGFEVESLVTADPAVEHAPAVYESLLEKPASELGVVFDWS